MTWTAAGTFSKDPGFDFEARCALGRAAIGVGDVGLVLATLDRISGPRPPHGPDPAAPGASAVGEPQVWFDEWSATGVAHDWALRSGHRLGELRAVADLLGLELRVV